MKNDVAYNSIDWSKHTDSIIECRCGAHFTSCNKTKFVDNSLITYTQKACPKCGSYTNAYTIRSDPETFQVGPNYD